MDSFSSREWISHIGDCFQMYSNAMDWFLAKLSKGVMYLDLGLSKGSFPLYSLLTQMASRSFCSSGLTATCALGPPHRPEHMANDRVVLAIFAGKDFFGRCSNHKAGAHLMKGPPRAKSLLTSVWQSSPALAAVPWRQPSSVRHLIQTRRTPATAKVTDLKNRKVHISLDSNRVMLLRHACC